MEKKVGDIIAKLLTEEKAHHVVIILLLSRFGPLRLEDVRYALGRGRRGSYYAARTVLLELEEMGLVYRETIGLYGRKVTVYRLTELGVKVARRLESALGFFPPEGYAPQPG
ncbi:MAG: hypothetical protein QXQ60_06345 [Thermofilum sp.]